MDAYWFGIFSILFAYRVQYDSLDYYIGDDSLHAIYQY